MFTFESLKILSNTEYFILNLFLFQYSNYINLYIFSGVMIIESSESLFSKSTDVETKIVDVTDTGELMPFFYFLISKNSF